MGRKIFLVVGLICLVVLGIYWLLFNPGSAVKASSPDPYKTPQEVWKPREISKDCFFTLEGHIAPVTSLSFSPDGKLLASAAKDVIDESDYTRDNFTYKDEVIRVWDTAQRDLVWHTPAKGSISGVSFIPGGEVMAITHVKSKIHSDKEIWAERWMSKDGKPIGSARLLSAYNDVDYGTAQLQSWDDTAFSPDGEMVVVGWSRPTVESFPMGEEGTYSILSTRDLHPHYKSFYSDHQWHVCQGFSGDCRAFFFGTAGLPLDSAADSGLIPTTTLGVYEIPGWKSSGGLEFQGMPSCIAISPSGKTLLVGVAVRRGTLFHLDAELSKDSGNPPHKDYTDYTEDQVLSAGCENYTSAVFSPDGAYAAAGDDNGDIHLFSTTDWKALNIINAHDGDVTCLAFSPDGRTMASGGADKMIRLWDVAHITVPSPPPSATAVPVQSPSPIQKLEFLRVNEKGYREFRNPKDGAEMILIPAGGFLMGPDGKEDPQHDVYLDDYYIYKYEVTNDQFKKFIGETGYRAQGYWNKYSYCNYQTWENPVVCVSWDDAAAYCKWAGVRLATEAEWEKAAKGTENLKYPWGNEWDADKCNWKNGPQLPGMINFFEGRGTLPVGSFPGGASPYGVMDMSGNVIEWCHDWSDPYYKRYYYRQSPEKNPQGPESGCWNRGCRGGNYYSDPDNLSTAYRDVGNIPTNWNDRTGFRCASSP